MSRLKFSLFALVALMHASTVSAAITITKIADTSDTVVGGAGTFSQFSTVAVHSGTVVFHAFGANDQQGLYRYDGSEISRIVDRTTTVPNRAGTFSGFSALSVRDGKVAFEARWGNQQGGIYAATSADLNVVADTQTTAPDGKIFVSLTNPSVYGDDVVFVGFTDPTYANPNNAIIRAHGGTFETLVDTTVAIPGGTGNFTWVGSNSGGYDNGNLAFRGSTTSQNGNYLLTDSGIRVVADLTSGVPGAGSDFIDVDTPFLSGDHVVFRGRSDIGAGIFADFGSGLFSLADTTTAMPGGGGLFTNFDTPSIDGSGIVFMGNGDGSQGIYTNLLGGLDAVVDFDDLIDGKSVSALQTYGQSLSGDSVVFRVEFSDGSQGIYMATNVVPEPSSVVLWSVLGLTVVGYRRWRSRRV